MEPLVVCAKKCSKKEIGLVNTFMEIYLIFEFRAFVICQTVNVDQRCQQLY